MELIQLSQLDTDIINKTNFDLIITASGYERRSTYMVEKYSPDAEVKIALAFRENEKKAYRRQNDIYFQKKGYQFFYAASLQCTDIFAFLGDFFENGSLNNHKPVFKMLVDYSSMSKTWYATLINYLLNAELSFERVEIYFSYTPSFFSEPQKPKQVKYIGPLLHNNSRIVSKKPVALIMGLGYETGRTEAIKKALHPIVSYAFFPDPAFDDGYISSVSKQNEHLLNKLPENNIVRYPVADLEGLRKEMTSLLLRLRLNYRVVIAPLGPKPFTLVSLCIAAQYPDVEVWRVSAGAKESIYERIPSGDPIMYRVEFCADEEADDY
ncbi:MAG TPA: hypothetical protein VE912_02065 [Bacteroidales bacterium]|nr:hypothetical protein [Bacteroidales bacterium]